MNDEHAPHLEKQAAADDVPLLEVSELTTYFPITAGLLNRTIANVHAVESVSFGIKRGGNAGVSGRERLRKNYDRPEHHRS